MATAAADVKLGFWVGLGVALALMAWALIQSLVAKAVKRNG